MSLEKALELIQKIKAHKANNYKRLGMFFGGMCFLSATTACFMCFCSKANFSHEFIVLIIITMMTSALLEDYYRCLYTDLKDEINDER